MTIGQFGRKIFGKKYAPIVGRVYRSFFVDLGKVVNSILPHIPKGAMIVDVGGGDGEPLNYLLSQRHDVNVKLIDRSLCIGGSLKKEYSNRVELYPGTSMSEIAIKVKHKLDVILILDVIHHIPAETRKGFFSELRTMIGDRNNEVRIIIKDLEPGYFRSSLGRIADRYITGDKKVSFIGCAAVSNMMLEAFGNTIVIEETDLFKLAKPDFALVFVYKQK